MEDALVPRIKFINHKQGGLNLVVMEDALVLPRILFIISIKQGLNPCCNGRCTRTQNKIFTSALDNTS